MDLAAALTDLIPELTSDRLRFRAFSEADFDATAAFFADDVSQFYGGPCDRDEAWRKFAVYSGHWMLRGWGPWAVERLDTGAFVGWVGPWCPEGWIEPEITWALVLGQHGHGFATEAAGRTLRAAYELFGWTTAVSVVRTENTASAGVARRLGATVERQIPFRGGVADVFRHRGPEDLASDTAAER
ncbi:MAG: GNAT family N-acetyltransferase [Actinomycetota bacterium]